MEVVERGVEIVDAFVVEEAEHLFHVVMVGFARVGRQSLLKCEIGGVFFKHKSGVVYTRMMESSPLTKPMTTPHPISLSVC